MSGKDSNFEVVYRNDVYNHFIPGKWVFFQRNRDVGGGFWLGQAYNDCYIFGIPWPVSLREGMAFLSSLEPSQQSSFMIDSCDDFELT